MTSRAQIQHAFSFIMFIIVAGFVAILGYKAISGLLGGSCDLDKGTFEERVTGLFDRYDDFGSLHKERLSLPCNYREICFVNNSVYGSTWSANHPDPDIDKVLSTASAAEFNVFLISDFAEPVGYTKKIIVENSTGILCVQARGGAVNLVFKGKGQKTLVEAQ